ncbi:hypothetical protein EYF80_042451 [Liparis tanakae]|uniref:Uncharacterized protein n=1 Tax=Liparis tanakae TaxID=230148 RepID=A0A4Z2G3D0_9TELE|nr:hypothetical protein EYF80_042451 [Liparis tanakae]
MSCRPQVKMWTFPSPSFRGRSFSRFVNPVQMPLRRTRALQFKRDAAERQKMSVAGRQTQGLGARPADVQAVVLQAVLLRAAGCELTVDAVVGAVAVAALLALPVRPEGLIGGQLAAVAHAAAIAACHAHAIPQREAVLALTPFLARQRARLHGVI